MEMLAPAGVRWIRMDLGWGGTERERRASYDFSAYDRLLAAWTAHKIGAVLIFDYSNPPLRRRAVAGQRRGRGRPSPAGPWRPRGTSAAAAFCGKCTTSRTSVSGSPSRT